MATRESPRRGARRSGGVPPHSSPVFVWTVLVLSCAAGAVHYFGNRGHDSAVRVPRFGIEGPATRFVDRTAPEIFPTGVSSIHFELRSNMDLPLTELAALAERARTAARRILGVSDGGSRAATEKPLPVYLCRDALEIRRVERLYGLPHVEVPKRAFRGGFYGQVPMIAVAPPEGYERAFLSHEVVHSVIQRVAPDFPDILNEGAAELIEMRVMEAEKTPLPADYDDDALRALGRMEAAKRLPSLRGLFSLSYTRFRQSPGDVDFYLGKKLCEVLLADQPTQSEIGPGLASLLRRYAHPVNAWDAFAACCDTRRVEGLWRSRLAAALRGR